jgi:hypothetical protein
MDFLQHNDAGLWSFPSWAFEYMFFQILQGDVDTCPDLGTLEIDIPGHDFDAGRVICLVVYFAARDVLPRATLRTSIVIYL